MSRRPAPGDATSAPAGSVAAAPAPAGHPERRPHDRPTDPDPPGQAAADPPAPRPRRRAAPPQPAQARPRRRPRPGPPRPRPSPRPDLARLRARPAPHRRPPPPPRRAAPRGAAGRPVPAPPRRDPHSRRRRDPPRRAAAPPGGYRRPYRPGGWVRRARRPAGRPDGRRLLAAARLRADVAGTGRRRDREGAGRRRLAGARQRTAVPPPRPAASGARLERLERVRLLMVAGLVSPTDPAAHDRIVRERDGDGEYHLLGWLQVDGEDLQPHRSIRTSRRREELVEQDRPRVDGTSIGVGRSAPHRAASRGSRHYSHLRRRGDAHPIHRAYAATKGIAPNAGSAKETETEASSQGT